MYLITINRYMSKTSNKSKTKKKAQDKAKSKNQSLYLILKFTVKIQKNNMVIKNLWSLDIDEAVVADRLNKYFIETKEKAFQVFFPINSQLKGMDLIIYNIETRKTITVQVKGSRSYLSKNGLEEYSWHQVKSDDIDPKKSQFFIFVTYYTKNTETKLSIEPSFMVIPTAKLLEIVTKHKKVQKSVKDKKSKKSGTYHFSFNLSNDKYFADYRDFKQHVNEDDGIDFSKYYNNFKSLIK